jgi:iron complex transport system ATP-binding protein
MARGKTITAVRKEEPATKISAAKKAAHKKAAKKSAASRTPRTKLVPLLEMRNVCVFRGGREVLHALDLTIAQGEHVAILGPNGCGKSTLIKTITRELYPLFDPTTSIHLFGRDTWNVSELRSLMGIVSNDVEPFTARPITGEEAVLSGFFSSVGLGFHHAVTEAMRRKARQVMRWLEIAHLAGREVSQMSSGEVRRVMIARALVHSPRALLFDEPSNSLDVIAQMELRQTMRKLARSGLTLLLITHHLPDVVPEIERVLFLRDGRIVADGPKNKLLTARRLSELFGTAVGITRRDGYYHLIS